MFSRLRPDTLSDAFDFDGGFFLRYWRESISDPAA
jgi:hypothetical protein